MVILRDVIGALHTEARMTQKQLQHWRVHSIKGRLRKAAARSCTHSLQTALQSKSSQSTPQQLFISLKQGSCF